MLRLAPLLLLVAACSSAGPLRYPVPLPPVTERMAVNVRSLEVRDAELPLYAELEEIYVEAPDGALVSDTTVLWADEPRRTLTQGLALALARTTTAQVAAEPWPLDEFPDARLDVRVETLVAGADGLFRLSGQYFVSREEGRDSAGQFAIAVPYAPGDVNAIARAQGVAISQLATTIAREALGAAGA